MAEGGPSRHDVTSVRSWSDWYVQQLSERAGSHDPACDRASASVHGELRRLRLGASQSRNPPEAPTAAIMSAARLRRREYELAARRRLAAEVAPRREDAHHASETRPLLQAVVEALPTFAWEDDGSTHSARDCTICMRDFDAGEVLVRLPCAHHFHRDCVACWLMRQGTCPLCRSRPPEAHAADSRAEERRGPRVDAAREGARTGALL